MKGKRSSEARPRGSTRTLDPNRGGPGPVPCLVDYPRERY
jgi:hypothetical protein